MPHLSQVEAVCLQTEVPQDEPAFGMDAAGDVHVSFMQVDKPGLGIDRMELTKGKLNTDAVRSCANLKQGLMSLVPSPPSVEVEPAAAVSSPALPSPHEGHIVAWYDAEDQIADVDLLKAYFNQNPKLAEQVSRMKTHKRTRQTDASLVRDYRFALEVYRLLLERKWEVRSKQDQNHFNIQYVDRQNESGRILNKSIMKHLGFSPAWFTKAKDVVALLDKLGPSSLKPDPVVLQRLSSAATVNKGDDILVFLQAQAKVAGIQQ